MQEENAQLEHERQAKLNETESKERIAEMKAHTDMTIAQAKLGTEGGLALLKAEIERIGTLIEDQRKHSFLEHESVLHAKSPEPGPPQGQTPAEVS